MLRKDHKIKWMVGAKKSFKNIKHAISEAPILISPYFEKDFLVFSYALEHTVVAIWPHKNDWGEEQPIEFFGKILRDGELRYSIM